MKGERWVFILQLARLCALFFFTLEHPLMSLFKTTVLRLASLIGTCVLFCGIGIFANDEVSSEDYIDKWKKEAVSQMIEYNIPASITLAQGMLESGNGVSTLALKSNNHFGIKCHSDWVGGRTYHDDDEKGECFRVYDHPRDSYEDHSKFLLKSRYAMLFELDLDDYKGWAKGLKKCGYATNPEYAEKLITIIERHNLSVLDLKGLDALAEVGKGETKVETEIVKEQQVISDRLGSESKARTARNSTTNEGGARRIRTTEHGIQFVFAREGDTQKSLAKELDMMPWQFRKYNGVSKSHVFNLGDKIYLQPKKNHAAYTWHTVHQGQTIWEISQIYGIKTSAIIRKNRLNPNESLQAGTKLSLQWPLSKEGGLPWYAKLLNAKES